jgi:hypothetical protein
MKFNPGQSRKVVNGKTYIRDSYVIQVDPPKLEKKQEPQIEIKMSGEPSLEPIIEETKIETNEPIRSEQMEKKPASTGSRAPRKRSGSSSKSN